MPDTKNLPQEVKENSESLAAPDIVIGVPSFQPTDGFEWAERMEPLANRVLIAYPGGAGPTGETSAFAPRLLPYTVSAGDRYLNAPTILDGGFHDILQASREAGAKCCCVWNNSLQDLSSGIVQKFTAPVLEQGFDLALPCYVETRLGSLINHSIVHPIVRALYGKRIRYSMAIDAAFSAQMVERLSQIDPKTKRLRSQLWITADAICSGLNICQVNIPVGPPHPPEAADVSTILALVLGRLFQDLERNTAFWQRPSVSQSVATFGEPSAEKPEDSAVDVQRLLETFQLGYRNLKEIWSVALPPAAFLELKKLTTLNAAAFHVPEDLWARIVYDFALAYRQRSINREHLLRALTPLYLAWVASFAIEAKDVPTGAVLSIRERVALAYEKQKPYLVSRWRWPDRFNP